jgi:sodium transport system permease protein
MERNASVFNTVKTIWTKELVDALRDRKALMTILISPVLTLIMVYGVIHFLVFLKKESQEITLYVTEIDQAQPLMAWLNEEGIETKRAPDNAIEAVRDHKIELLLSLGEDFAQEFNKLQIPEIELIYDQTRKEISGKVVNVKIAIRRWGNNIGALRLIARGVSPQMAIPIQIVDTDVSEQRSGAAFLFGIVAMIITIMVFSSSVGVSVDMMAGEREKRSLEPLLLSPVSRMSLLAGKWLTAVVITLGVIVLINLSLFFLIPQLPLDQIGVRTELKFIDSVYLVLIALPLILLSTIIQLLVSIFSKSFKEAQSYIALLLILPILIGYYVIWSDIPQAWQYWVPVMGSQNLMEDILTKGYSSVTNYAANISVTVALSMVLAVITVRQLRREKIIYG